MIGFFVDRSAKFLLLALQIAITICSALKRRSFIMKHNLNLQYMDVPMIRILSLSLVLFFSIIISAHAKFTSPSNTTVTSGNYTLSWDNQPNAAAMGSLGGSGSGMRYKLTEQKLNDGSLAKPVSLSGSFATSVAVSGKTYGLYEYTLEVLNCSSYSGCWYSVPPDGRVIITVNTSGTAVLSPVETATSIGVTPYSADVNNNGEGVISVPIQIPPGVNGMQPRLSLNYSSGGTTQKSLFQSAGGLLGYGWSLSGISSISRCTIGKPDVYMRVNPNDYRNTAMQWMRPKLSYDDTDNLCLDGELLVLVEGTHLRDGAKYRTFKDSFRLVIFHEFYDVYAQKNASWLYIKNPDGSTAIYGMHPYARAEKQIERNNYSSPLTPVFIWSIQSHEDRFNNQIYYAYNAPDRSFSYQPNKQRIFPNSITYPGGGVSFTYMPVNSPVDLVANGSYSLIDDGSAYIDRYRFNHDGANQLIRVSVSGSTTGKQYRILGSNQTEQQIKNHGLKPSGIQECGIIDQSTTYSCISPLVFNWQPRASMYPEYPQASHAYYELEHINNVVDGFGAKTVFDYSLIKDNNADDNTNKFLETPFAIPTTNGRPVSDSHGREGDAVVAIRIKRSTALAPDNFHSTAYQYRRSGEVNMYGLGFVGFSAMRIQDESTGIVTYKQYELTKSWSGVKGLRGEVSATYQFNGIYGQSGVVPISKIETRYGLKTLTHTNGSATYLPTTDQISTLSYENGGFVGASIKTNTYNFNGNVLSQLISTTKTGDTLNSMSFAPSYWSHTAPYSLNTTRITSEETITTDFKNFTSTADWRIGFTNLKKHEFYNAVKGSHTDFKEQKVAYVEKAGTMLVETETKFPGDPENELVNAYTYDDSGRKSSITTSGKNIETRTTLMPEYRVNTPTKVINPLSHISTATDFDYRFFKPTRTTDANGLVTFTYYDAFGRPDTVIDPDGVISTVTHVSCATTYCEAIPTKLGSVTPAYYKEFVSQVTPKEREYYDSRNRIIRKETQGFTAGEWVRSDTQYDEFGRVYKTSLPYKVGAVVEYVTNFYDTLGRLIRVENPDGGVVATAYIRETETGYPQLVVETTETVKKSDGSVANTLVKRNYFDSDAQLIKTIDAYGSSNPVTTTFEYDALGNATKTIVNGGTDGSTQSTAVFDHAGNRTSLTDPNAGTVQTLYTALGEVRWSRDNKANVITYAYDKLGRVKSRTSIDGTENWYYDNAGAKGLISYITNNNGYEQYYFYQDAYRAARLTSVQTKITVPGFATKTFTESMTYDYYGRPLKTTSPSGYAVTQQYNAQGYPSSMWRGDNLYALATTTKIGALGVEEESLPGGITTKRNYDSKSGRPLSILTTQGAAKIQDLTYQWRTNGSMQGKADGKSGTVITDTYDYDIHDRLKKTETGTSSTIQRTLTQAYNNLGNIKSNTSTNSADAQVTAYQYGDATVNAGPHAVSGATINGVYTIINYDLNGAVVAYTPTSVAPKKFIAYNSINQPTKITVGTSQDDTNPIARDEFKYSPDGDRYYKKSTYQQSGALRTEHTFYVGDYEVIIFDSGATYQSEKSQIGNLLHVRKTPFAGSPVELQYVLHRDHLGSTDAVTLDNGSVLANLAFEPFGARRNSSTLTSNITSPQLNDLFLKMDALPSDGYTGHEALDRTGFIHMNGRVYDPQLSRFLSPDPFVQAPTNGQNWNRYSYVMNNPLKYTDPTGYKTVRTCVTMEEEQYSETFCTDTEVGGGDDGATELDSKILENISGTSMTSSFEDPASHVLANPESYIGRTDFVNEKGEHQCVELIKQTLGAPRTIQWKLGAKVDANTPKGTAIATRGPDGRYGIYDKKGNFIGGHAAILLSADGKGTLKVIDQYKKQGVVKENEIRDKPDESKPYISQDASTYHVLLW